VIEPRLLKPTSTITQQIRLGSTTKEQENQRQLVGFGMAGDVVHSFACGFSSTAVYLEDGSLYVGGNMYSK
jgi:hypothetical protein